MIAFIKSRRDGDFYERFALSINNTTFQSTRSRFFDKNFFKTADKRRRAVEDDLLIVTVAPEQFTFAVRCGAFG